LGVKVTTDEPALFMRFTVSRLVVTTTPWPTTPWPHQSLATC
jgi:hypothetical protein